MLKISNSSKIIKLVEQLRNIQQLVKCPICLEIVENPLKIGCNHIFCRECLKKYEEDAPKISAIVCPVCRTSINRRQKREYKNAQAVSTYIHNVDKVLKDVTNCNIMDIASNKLTFARNLNETVSSRKQKNSYSMSKKSDAPAETPEKRKMYKNFKVQSGKKTSKKIKTEGKLNITPSVKIKTNKSRLDDVTNKLKLTGCSENNMKSSKKDAFDILKQSENVNPYSNFINKVTRTYQANSKYNKNIICEDKVLKFHDNANKTRILQWLNDNRNKFDRMTLTQTQQDDTDSEAESLMSFSMPSVSQINQNNLKVKVSNDTQTKIQNIKDTQLIHFKEKENVTSNYRKRAHSLDRYVKKIYPKPRIKRHSIACESQDYDNVTIEIIDSENELNSNNNENRDQNNQMWNLLEEECLKSMEIENYAKLKSIENDSSNVKQRGTKRKRKNNVAGGKETSNWVRLEAISNSTKKMKKLNFSLSSETKRNRKRESEHSDVSTVLEKSDKDICNLNGKDSHFNDKTNKKLESEQSAPTLRKTTENLGNINKNIEKTNKNEKTKQPDDDNNKPSVSYDLNVMESYFSVKIQKYVETEDKEENTDDSISLNNSQSIKNKNQHAFETKDLGNKSLENERNNFCNSVIIERVPYNSESLKSNQDITKDINVLETSLVTGSNSQDMNKESLIIQLVKAESNEELCNIQDTNVPSSKIIIEGSKNEENIKMELSDNSDDVFSKPTQFDPASHDNLNVNEIYRNLKELLRKFLDEMEYQKTKLSKEEIEIYEPTLKTIRSLLSNENEESVNKTSSLICSTDVQTQTESSLNFCHTSIQTVVPILRTVFTQTDPLNGFYISSNESFRTPTKTNTQVQTDNVFCPNCNHLLQLKSTRVCNTSLSKAKDLAQKPKSSKVSENYVFTQSLDNINFETQDIIKQNKSSFIKQKKIKSRNKDIVLDDVRKEITENAAQEGIINNENDNKKEKEPSQTCSKSLSFQSSNECKESSLSLNKIRGGQTSQLKVSADVHLPKDTASGRKLLNRQITAPESGNKSKFKRIRMPQCDSDSDSEISVQAKKICNKYLREDLSVEFNSQNEKPITQDQNSIQNQTQRRDVLLSGESDNIDYEEFLEKVMKKYDSPEETVGISNAKTNEICSKEGTEDIIAKCQRIIQETMKLKPQPLSRRSLKTQSTQVATKLSLNTVQEFQQEFQSSNSLNNVPQHNPIEKINKTDQNKNNCFSSPLFENSEEYKSLNGKDETIKNICIVNSAPKKHYTRQELDSIVREISHEFENSFDAEINAELEILHESQKKNKKARGKDDKKNVVLQDITLNKDYKKDLQPKVDDKEVELNKNIDDSFEDDMFDENDVVESTPQKNVEKEFAFSQTSGRLQRLPSEISGCVSLDQAAINCFNMTFTPPPEFQDSEHPVASETQSEKQNTDIIDPTGNNLQRNERADIINSQEQDQNVNIDFCGPTGKSFQEKKQIISSLTPDLLLGPIQSFFPIKTNVLETSTPNIPESQTNSLKSLSLSPIGFNDDVRPVNPIESVQASKFSPLTIIKVRQWQTKGPPTISSTPKQKSILNYVKPDDLSGSSSKFEDFNRSQLSQKSLRPCVACTRLSKDQVTAINSLSSKKIISYSSNFSKSVTHLIITTNKKGCIKDHTMKYVLAVASGIWVLSYKWIEDCIKANRIVSEEPYEVLDISGVAGPKQSRLTKKRELLKGYKIYASKPFVSTTQKEVEMVITMLGGKIVARPDDLALKDGCIPLIITEARACQDSELFEVWFETLRVITVDLEWLSRSVGQYSLQSLNPFAAYSDDSIYDLGYPPNLLEDVANSYSTAS